MGAWRLPSAACAGLALLAGCGHPVPVCDPSSLHHVIRLGPDGSPGETTARLVVRSSSPDESVTWQGATSHTWLSVSPPVGSTPATLAVAFDPLAMSIGANEGHVRVVTAYDNVHVPLVCELEAMLVVEPSSPIRIRGERGAQRSTTTTLRLSTPGADGVMWNAEISEPWIRVEPRAGTTPATITVSADLAGVAADASGHVSIVAPHCWAGSPSVLPLEVTVLDTSGTGEQLRARVLTLQADFSALDREVAPEPATQLPAGTTLTEYADGVRQAAARAQAMSERIGPMIAELQAFLDEHGQYEAELDLAGVRKDLAAVQARLDERVRTTAQWTASLRVGDASIRGNGEWQALGDGEVTAGDTVFVEATGSWTLGAVAGYCGPAGQPEMSEGALDPQHPFGSLLIAAGDQTIAHGTGSGQVTGAGGKLKARCNDREPANNAGAIAVHFVVMQLPAQAARSPAGRSAGSR